MRVQSKKILTDIDAHPCVMGRRCGLATAYEVLYSHFIKINTNDKV